MKRRDEQGWASRSAFKLLEMHEKHKLALVPGMRVLDLGAAPGGWTQVALRKGCVVTSLDLLPHSIPPSEPHLGKLRWIQGDFTSAAVQSLIAEEQYALIMSDMAPNYSGIDDHIRLMGLAEGVFHFSRAHLVSGGALVIKISRGGEEVSFRDSLKPHFGVVKFVKPDASRKESTEMYVMASGFKAK